MGSFWHWNVRCEPAFTFNVSVSGCSAGLKTRHAHTDTHLKSFKQNYLYQLLGRQSAWKEPRLVLLIYEVLIAPVFFGSGGPCQCGAAKSCHVFPNFDNSLTTSLCWTSIVSPFMDHTRLCMQFRFFSQKQTHRHIVWTENYKYVQIYIYIYTYLFVYHIVYTHTTNTNIWICIYIYINIQLYTYISTT